MRFHGRLANFGAGEDDILSGLDQSEVADYRKDLRGAVPERWRSLRRGELASVGV